MNDAYLEVTFRHGRPLAAYLYLPRRPGQKSYRASRVEPELVIDYLRTFIVAPLTTGGHPYPFRVPCRFRRRAGHVVLDQIRTIDRERLVRRMARLSPPVVSQVLQVLQEMSAE